MKNIIIVIVALSVVIIASCSTKKCDFCGGMGADNIVENEWLDVDSQLCDDCLVEYEAAVRRSLID